MKGVSYFVLGLVFLTQGLSASNNKESFGLIADNFSRASHINYEGLSEEIRYHFKDNNLLRAALYPLIKQDKSPAAVQFAKRKFEHLEFYGDAVLGCFIRERLLKLFPDQDLGSLHQLYSFLTGNKTLAEVYLRHLSIERFLPFPEKLNCKYCDLVEAIIGAICLDDSINGPKNAKKFIMFILDDHLLQEQISKISGHMRLNPVYLPHLNDALVQICSPERIQNESPKALLHEVLSTAWMDYPTYNVTIRTDNMGLPILYAFVSGAQIGREFTDLHGEGYTRQEAEENAAIEALNFLAQKELIKRTKVESSNLKYRVLLERFIDIRRSEGIDLVPRTSPSDQFKVQLILKARVIGEGLHVLKEEAKEQAAYQAYNYLSKEMATPAKKSPSPKNYRQLVNEYNTRNKSYKIDLFIISSAENRFVCQAKIKDRVIGEGIGNTKANAREKAAEQALTQLSNSLIENTGTKKPTKNFRNLLEEIAVALNEEIDHLWTYTYIFNFGNGGTRIAENGLTASEAKERASLKACYSLIQFEEETNRRRDNTIHSTPLIARTPKLPIPKEPVVPGEGSQKIPPTKLAEKLQRTNLKTPTLKSTVKAKNHPNFAKSSNNSQKEWVWVKKTPEKKEELN